MITETTVTRFVSRKEVVIPPPTLAKANEEAAGYAYQRAGNGHYVCMHGEVAHIIIERDGVIGCSCGDFTHRCKDNEGCKHIADFLKRKNPPAAKLDKRIAMDLIAAGWQKTEHGNLYPPDRESAVAARDKDVETAMGAGWNQDNPEKQSPEVVAELPPVIPPDPDLDLGVDDPLPEQKRHFVKCQHCGMLYDGQTQEKADAWKEDHEAICAKNPVNQKTTPNPGMMSATCQYCGKAIKRKLAADLKAALEAHEATCPKRPKEPEPPQKEETKTKPEQKSTAVSTWQDMPDERVFTIDKVRRYCENRGGFYKNQRGEEVPDSAAMSLYALDSCHISSETVLIEKDADQAKAIVRGRKGDVSVDASVILRFDVLRRRELLKMAKKYPKAIRDWSDQMMPNLDLNFVLKDRTPMISLGEHMINFAIDQEQFADRTAETLARRRVFDMLTGVDRRDAAEVAIEDADAAAMGSVKE